MVVRTKSKLKADIATKQMIPIVPAAIAPTLAGQSGLPISANANEITPPTPLIELRGLAFTPNAQAILDQVSQEVEFIYNTPAVTKIRVIAEKRWYQFWK